MRERKIVKLRVDMYEDTKFKIIDMKPERDLIQCVWTKILTLAGKVNLEGDLYMSRNIPFTIETLAIEFNRDANQVKLALDVFMELEMIELTEGNVYRVKNFAKHHNIKVKEQVKSKEKMVKVASKNEIDNKEVNNTTIQVEAPITIIDMKEDLETDNINNKVDDKSKENTYTMLKANTAIPLDNKKNKKTRRKKKEKTSDIISEDYEDDYDIVSFEDYDENKPLAEGETLIARFDVR